MLQPADNDHDDIRPDDIRLELTSSSVGATLTINKPKRTRKPWVYKSDYELLKKKYDTVCLAAFWGWGLTVVMAIIFLLL